MDITFPVIGALNWLKNILYEPVSYSFKDWFAIKKNKRICKKNNELFAINKRITEHIIYSDGTLILNSKYFIEMLKDGDCKLKKGYIAINNNTNLQKINKIFDSFENVGTKNRFKNYLLVCEIEEKVKRDISIFKTNIDKTTEKEIFYSVIYTNLKKGDKFSFSISITIPKEFEDKKEDSMQIKYEYGIYEFISKIDKQNLKSKVFSPICEIKEKRLIPQSFNNIYYNGFKWKIRNPKKEGKIILKFD
jgi:hypothetical protein